LASSGQSAARFSWDITVTGLANRAGKGSQTGMSYRGDAELKSGKLPAGFSAKIRRAKKGAYPTLPAVLPPVGITP
jgi:hypothetical protein